jgi:hypothetical protein
MHFKQNIEKSTFKIIEAMQKFVSLDALTEQVKKAA